MLEPVYQTVQLAWHCSCCLQTVLKLLALLLHQVLDLGPARLDSGLPVAECAACVWMSAAQEVGTQTLTVLQHLTLVGQLTVHKLSTHTVKHQWSAAAHSQQTTTTLGFGFIGLSVTGSAGSLTRSPLNPWDYHRSIFYMWKHFHVPNQWHHSIACLATITAEHYKINTSFSRMRVIYHNWSATKQRPHPQSVAEISRHSVLSGDRIRQCETMKPWVRQV